MASTMDRYDGSALGLAGFRASDELEMLLPGEPDFDAACVAWNARFTHRPVAIVRPASTAGVAAVVDAARARGLKIAIQATGHGPTREADGAILLDLSRMTDVRVEPETRRAVIGGGADWEAVLAVVTPHGLAPVLGSSPKVGAVGYILGGGVGWLYRKYGSGADSARAFELVTADGRARHVTEEKEPELFWALRGAGAGHLGVVTSVEVELYPIAELYAGNLYYPAEMADEVLRRWRDWIPTVPAGLTSAVTLMNFPPLEALPPELRGMSSAIVRGAFDGSMADGERLMAHWREWREPAIDAFGPLPFERVGEISQDPVEPIPVALTGSWMRALSDASIDALVKRTFVGGGPAPLLFAEVRHTGHGATASRSHAMAASETDAIAVAQLLGVTPTPAAFESVRVVLDAVMQAMEPDLTGRHYLNYMEGDERRDSVEQAIGSDAARRLAQIKAQVDPDDIFDHGLRAH
jgi:FAD/FMN-containing dehydrogenase